VQLFDLYGALLTGRQQQLLRHYFLDDLSLGEIAKQWSITRQAVSDSLRRATAELEHLEARLHLLAARQREARHRQAVATGVDALERVIIGLDGRLKGHALAALHGAVRRLRRTLSVD
jgi:predicted DNA-binding protein YlxM (UPF0122 family)